MRLPVYLALAFLVHAPIPAAADAEPPGLFGVSAESYDGAEPKAAEFKPIEPGVCGGSLRNSSKRWERNQADWNLTWDIRSAGCGLIAAEALVRFNAGAPGLDKINEIKNTAVSKNLWDQNQGMHGPGMAGEQGLMDALGFQVDIFWGLQLSVIWQKVVASLNCGKPVIISTRSHYFFVEGYNDAGQLFVGYTGEIKTGQSWMTLSEIYNSGGDPLVPLIPK
ncbi:MAG TPA: hypothetical protein PL037_02765 [Elusimicrobiales bacterium]|nr:hypothetical protein [Elusimicrobiales bacterium]